MSAVRVVRDVPCPSCKGRGEYYDKHGYEDCPRCHGTGTTIEPVTCAECKHFQPLREDGGLCLTWIDASGYAGEVASSFACAAWSPRHEEGEERE